MAGWAGAASAARAISVETRIFLESASMRDLPSMMSARAKPSTIEFALGVLRALRSRLRPGSTLRRYILNEEQTSAILRATESVRILKPL